MSTTSYQTFTIQTPFGTYRQDFMRRTAMCGARYQPIAEEGEASVVAIDARIQGLQALEDAIVRLDAIEDAERIDVLRAYKMVRGTFALESKEDVLTLLPVAPSRLGTLGAKNLTERVEQAIANLDKLPADHALRAVLLPALVQELGEFKAADKSEDEARRAARSARLAIHVYKTELSTLRNMQLGDIQKITGDRAMTAMFTIGWRKAADPEPAPQS